MVDTQSTDNQYSHKETTHNPHNNPAIRKASQQFQTNLSDAAMEDQMLLLFKFAYSRFIILFYGAMFEVQLN